MEEEEIKKNGSSNDYRSTINDDDNNRWFFLPSLLLLSSSEGYVTKESSLSLSLSTLFLFFYFFFHPLSLPPNRIYRMWVHDTILYYIIDYYYPSIPCIHIKIPIGRKILVFFETFFFGFCFWNKKIYFGSGWNWLGPI